MQYGKKYIQTFWVEKSGFFYKRECLSCKNVPVISELVLLKTLIFLEANKTANRNLFRSLHKSPRYSLLMPLPLSNTFMRLWPAVSLTISTGMSLPSAFRLFIVNFLIIKKRSISFQFLILYGWARGIYFVCFFIKFYFQHINKTYRQTGVNTKSRCLDSWAMFVFAKKTYNHCITWVLRLAQGLVLKVTKLIFPLFVNAIKNSHEKPL